MQLNLDSAKREATASRLRLQLAFAPSRLGHLEDLALDAKTNDLVYPQSTLTPYVLPAFQSTGRGRPVTIIPLSTLLSFIDAPYFTSYLLFRLLPNPYSLTRQPLSLLGSYAPPHSLSRLYA